jgi:putative sterol carrier protein
MPHKFPSAPWTEAFKEQINSSDTYASAAKNWEGDLTFVVEDTNEGIYLDLWHGECRAAEYLSDPHSKAAEFTISAPMAKWRAVLAGTLDPIQGMVTRQIKLDGNLVKVMKNVKAAQELVKCATRVDTVFE